MFGRKHPEYGKPKVVRLDSQVQQIVGAIRSADYIGMPGDGIVLIAALEMTLKDQTGAVDGTSL